MANIQYNNKRIDEQSPNVRFANGVPVIQSKFNDSYGSDVGDVSGGITADFGGLRENRIMDKRTPAEIQQDTARQMIDGKPQSALRSYTASRDSLGQSFNPSANAGIKNKYGQVAANMNGSSHGATVETAIDNYINAKANYSRDRINQINNRGVDITVGSDDFNVGYRSQRYGNNPSSRDIVANAKITDGINANMKYGNAGKSVGGSWKGDNGWSATADFTRQTPDMKDSRFRNNGGNRFNVGFRKSFGGSNNVVPRHLTNAAALDSYSIPVQSSSDTAWDAYKDIRI